MVYKINAKRVYDINLEQSTCLDSSTKRLNMESTNSTARE